MIFDTDDMHDTNHRFDLLWQLKEANPDFRMTAFCVPAYCPDEFLESIPDWVEVAAHGWHHGGRHCPDPYEAVQWSYEDTVMVLDRLHDRFVKVWKSPGWQISDGTYQALLEQDWAVADQHYNDARRPPTLRSHCLGDGDHVHTHVQNVCGNGLEESFPALLERVKGVESFELISEVVQ